jgi:hypothetical protein
VDGGTAILDNRSPRLGSPRRLSGGHPKYAVNASHRWVFVAAGGNQAAGEIFANPPAQPGG